MSDQQLQVDERLRSAAILRDMPGHAPWPATAQLEQERIRRHFDAVLGVLAANSEHSLDLALARLEASKDVPWSSDEGMRRRVLLRQRRWEHIARLRSYQKQGFFPLNEHDSSRALPIFVDRHDTACAVGHLMRESGWSTQVQAIAALDNHVHVPDADSGPLVAWVLASGLTQEEAALIQPSYFVPPEPHTPLATLLNGGAVTEGVLRYDNFELSASGVGRLPDPDLIHVSPHPGEKFDNGTHWLWTGGLEPFQFGKPDKGATVSISYGYDVTVTEPHQKLDRFFLTTRNGFESFYNFGNIAAQSSVVDDGINLGTVKLDMEDFQSGASLELLFTPRSQVRVQTDFELTDPADFSAIMHEFEVVLAMDGDANHDGKVSGADMISVEENYRATGHYPLMGDGSYDGNVSGQDLIAVHENYGTAVDGVTTRAIPEPASVAVFALGCLTLVVTRRAQNGLV